MKLAHGATDVTTYVYLGDSATGQPETGLTITTIDATYTRNRATPTKNDLTALAAIDSAHGDNQGFEVSSTNAPGLYRIDWPDAAFASGVDKVLLTVTCSGCHPAHQEVQLNSDEASILADTNELQTDWANGGRLDLILDARASQSSVNDVDTDVNTLLSRITSGLFTGITSLAQWLGLLAGKQTGNSTARTELRATGAGSGTYDETTDSLEGIKDTAATVGAVVNAFYSEALPGSYGSGTAGKIFGDNINATISSRATQTSVDDLPTNAELATSQAAADDATLAAIAALNNLSAAQVNAEVDAALADIHLDHLLATTYDPASKPGAADALLNELVESDAGVSRFTANALEQGPSGGGGTADWTADERTAIRSILGIPASGTTPDDPTIGILDTIRDRALDVKAKTDNLPSDPADASDVAASFSTVNSTLSTISGYLDTEIAAIKAKTDNLPADPADQSSVEAAIAAIPAAPSASTVASQVRTELTTELGRIDVATSTRLATAGYTAPANSDIVAIKAKTDNLPASPAATGDIPSAAVNASATRTELTTELGRIDAAVSTRLATAGYTAPANSDITAIKAKTDSLTFTVAGQVDANMQSVNDVLFEGDGTENNKFGPAS